MGRQLRLLVEVRSINLHNSTPQTRLTFSVNAPSAPGLKFGFTGETVAITFGNLTSDGVLVGYRLSGLDWMFTNITAGATHLLVSSATTDGANLTWPVYPNTLELRVTNWAYGVQVDAVHVAEGESLVRVPEDRGRTVELIGDSLTSGMYSTYEGLTSFGYGIGAGLGDAEYSVTAFPGICAADQDCWGNPRGQERQWFYTCDTSYRAQVLYGGKLVYRVMCLYRRGRGRCLAL